MKQLIAIITALGIAAGASYAGCGKTVTDEGKLSSFDAEKKALVVELAGGKTAKITVTPTTEAKGKDGKKADVASLVGKKVKVVSEHSKAQTITEA